MNLKNLLLLTFSANFVWSKALPQTSDALSIDNQISYENNNLIFSNLDVKPSPFDETIKNERETLIKFPDESSTNQDNNRILARRDESDSFRDNASSEATNSSNDNDNFIKRLWNHPHTRSFRDGVSDLAAKVPDAARSAYDVTSKYAAKIPGVMRSVKDTASQLWDHMRDFKYKPRSSTSSNE